MSLFDLTGSTAVVTGARRGIGLAIAEALAQAGADIIGVSAAMEESGSEVERRVTAAGRAFTPFTVDFADRAAVTALGERVADADILVNNAGTIERAPAADHPLALWDRVLEVNLNAQFALSQLAGRSMLARGRGKIIFTASLLSFQGGINVPGYTASKHGIAGLTKALANEWMPGGVNVNAIAPGYIATDNTEALQRDPERSKSILDRIPAGRWGTATDIGGAAVFLASRAADYVSGVVLPVDGGWMAR
jgi:2-dehydro-3-deoxy-D-gluconate 5-dehydrogenase